MIDDQQDDPDYYDDYTGTRAEALIAAYNAVPLFDIVPTYQMTKADFNRAVMAAINHIEDVAKAIEDVTKAKRGPE